MGLEDMLISEMFWRNGMVVVKRNEESMVYIVRAVGTDAGADVMFVPAGASPGAPSRGGFASRSARRGEPNRSVVR